MTRHRVASRTALVAVLAGIFALGGCGSSDGGSDSGGGSSGNGTVTLENAWSRATAASQTNGVVYLEVVNDTDEAVTLTGASVPSDIAMQAQLHETTTESSSSTSMGSMGDDTSSTTMGDMGAMTGMREVPSVEVKPNSTFSFEPGGYHIMLMDLQAPLETGQSFPITLHRTAGADLSATATVRDA